LAKPDAILLPLVQNNHRSFQARPTFRSEHSLEASRSEVKSWLELFADHPNLSLEVFVFYFIVHKKKLIEQRLDSLSLSLSVNPAPQLLFFLCSRQARSIKECPNAEKAHPCLCNTYFRSKTEASIYPFLIPAPSTQHPSLLFLSILHSSSSLHLMGYKKHKQKKKPHHHHRQL
jgi:hypothetical protein